MSELVDFLEARLADDEAFIEQGWLEDAPFDPARVLREVTAKRTILALVVAMGDNEYAMQGYADDVLRALAAPFSDHPDFQEQWR